MEIISIEKKTFEAMMTRFEMFAAKVQMLCQRHSEKKMKKWYDNQDVCLILRISPRTLQTLRDNGTLGYTQINHKMFYKPEDVQNAITVVEDRKRIQEIKRNKKQS
ncbi:MAG: helix-turn-helix domain-containing protein [Candidatus Symbiothrix sp.]|jgi:hypothetical protein|nr:helix-turn-helix domain-containing protein [Candidatus Symbiothrix sp.]